MSKRKKQKNRPVATRETVAEPIRVVATPKVNERRSIPVQPPQPLIFGPETYKWLGGGFLLIVVGFLFMLGGRGDDPTVFDEGVIYSFWKITFAPIVILAGLAVTTYAIFKK